MRIRVIGDSDSAIAIRGMLSQDTSVVVSEVGYVYTVEVIETTGTIPTVDGVDSDWERRFIERISKAAGTDVLLLRVGGIQSDQHIRIGVPSDSSQPSVERGIFQAILQMVNQQRGAVVKRTWADKVRSWFA